MPRTPVVLPLSVVALLAVACAPSSPSVAEVDAGPPPDLYRPHGLGNLCPTPPGDPASPLAYGYADVDAALVDGKLGAPVCVVTADAPGAQAALDAAGATLDARPESFAAVWQPGGAILVVGRDPTGAMYGALEVAERVRLDGANALTPGAAIVRTPLVPVRAANLFLVLPAPGETAWWFRDPAFWTEYLDLLARSRIDFLDLHAMYNLDNTVFPNALLYFATSKSFPSTGIAPAERAANLDVLNRVIAQARARGIRVGLMSYSSNESIDGEAVPTSRKLTEPQQQVYVREAARDLATRAPGLWRLGFRIGESYHDATWYADTFIAGVHQANTGIGIYTRTWLSDKASVMKIVAAAGGDVIVEAKYNGEQLGLPYPVQTFSDEGWTQYGYENYLQPPSPYSFVFQIRAGGTHRIFREASYAHIRRAVMNTIIGGARGFTLEPTHAYFPQRDYYHAHDEDRFSPFTFRRDELEYALFGRLGYDPATPERAFRALLARRVGTDGLWPAVQAASEIVPWIQAGHTCGPDHRDFAAELELGGAVGYWATDKNATPVVHSCGYYAHGGKPYHGPFDTFAVASPYDTAADVVAGRATTRLSSLDVARRVLAASAQARAAQAVAVDAKSAEARDVVRESVALADLGEHFGHKLRSATLLAVYQRAGDPAYLTQARVEIAAAHAAWKRLVADTAYIAPFREMLRMHPLGLTQFHWSKELDRLQFDLSSIDALQKAVEASPPPWVDSLPDPGAWIDQPRDDGPGLAQIAVDPPDGKAAQWTVTAVLGDTPPPGATVRILWKPFSGFEKWRAVTATGTGTEYSAVIAGGGGGALLAVEVAGGPGEGWRYPSVLTDTPYVTLAP